MKLRALLVVAICAATATAADASDAQWFSAEGARSWLASYDSTLIGRRIHSEFSYEDEEDGHSTGKLATSARFAFSPWKRVALGAQVELPVEWSETGSGYASGLGDFEFRAGFVVRLSPVLRWGGGLNLKFPTATNSALGEDSLELKPITAVSWNALSWLNLGVTGSYSVTPSESGPDGVDKLEIKLPVAFRISDVWSGALTYKQTWDFNEDDEATYKAEIGVTRLLGENRRFALSPAIEVPLSTESFEWKAILGLSWNF